MPTNRLRLQKFLADCGVASRRGAEKLITQGVVKCNGVVVTELGTSIDPNSDQIAVNNNLVKPLQLGIVLLNKPTGVITTMRDPHGRRCVADLLPKRFRGYVPVGRLDYESSGLIVMTNDGELANLLLHPRYESEKIYRVKVEGRIPNGVLEKIERGVTLNDGPIRARVKVLNDAQNSTVLEVRIHEGRNRIIRRMMDAVGFPVLELERISHGPFRLGRMRPGEIRVLQEREYRTIRSKLFSSQNQ